MRRFSAIITIAALLFAAASCKKDDTLRYNNVTMGNVVNGSFISDQGNTFNIVENNCGKQLENDKRLIVSCDVLRQVSGKENEYDVRLNQFVSVFTKNPVKLSEITDDERKVENPICINDLWFAGGYVNMYIMFLVKEDSKTTHMINLVLDDSVDPSKDGYKFILRHNAYEDIPSEEKSDFDEFVLGGTYVSFPISDLIKVDEAKFTLDWKWYETVGMGITSKIEDYSRSFNWTRNVFEQAPIAIAPKAAKAQSFR